MVQLSERLQGAESIERQQDGKVEAHYPGGGNTAVIAESATEREFNFMSALLSLKKLIMPLWLTGAGIMALVFAGRMAEVHANCQEKAGSAASRRISRAGLCQRRGGLALPVRAGEAGDIRDAGGWRKTPNCCATRWCTRSPTTGSGITSGARCAASALRCTGITRWSGWPRRFQSATASWPATRRR